MRAIAITVTVLAFGGAVVGALTLSKLFDDEREIALASLAQEVQRQNQTELDFVSRLLRDNVDRLPTSVDTSQIANDPALTTLLVVEGDRQIWPPAAADETSRREFRAAWDLANAGAGPHVSERVRLLSRLLRALKSETDVNDAWVQFVNHRDHHRLARAVEAHTLVRLVEALAVQDAKRSRAASSAISSDEVAGLFAGEELRAGSPEGLFSLVLQVRSVGVDDLVKEPAQQLERRVVDAAGALGLPTANFETAAAIAPLSASSEELSFENLGDGCRWVAVGGTTWLGCRRGNSWIGRAFVQDAWLARAHERRMATTPFSTATLKWRGPLAGSIADLSTTTLSPTSLSAGLIVSDQNWVRRRQQIEDYHRIKLSLLALLAFLIATIVALSIYTRRQREAWVQAKENLVQAKEDLLQAVSHELKTPVASIRLLAETLQRRLDPAGDAKDYPARIVREADRMQHLTENLLSFQRVAKGKWQLSEENIDVEDLLDDVVLDVESVRRIGDEVKVSVAPGIHLRADRELVHLALRNLVKNALHYRCEGKSAVVEIQVRKRGDEVEFLVVDNGPGVAAPVGAVLFEAFARGATSPGGRGAGTGLGLALARSSMRYHGGDAVLVSSSSVTGSAFALRLPENGATT